MDGLIENHFGKILLVLSLNFVFSSVTEFGYFDCLFFLLIAPFYIYLFNGFAFFLWIVSSGLGLIVSFKKFGKDFSKKIFQIYLKPTARIIYQIFNFKNHWNEIKNCPDPERIEKWITACKYIKYFGLIMALMAGFLAFKSEDEKVAKTATSFSAISAVTGIVSEATKELILEPQKKRLEDASNLKTILGLRGQIEELREIRWDNLSTNDSFYSERSNV